MKRTAFHNRVSAEAHGKADHEFARFLRQTENVDQWHAALVDLHQDIDQQLAERKLALDEEHTRCLAMGDAGKPIYFAAKNEYNKWKASATRFKQSIDQRMREIKMIRRQIAAQPVDEAWALLKLAAQIIPRTGDGAEWHERFAKLRSEA